MSHSLTPLLLATTITEEQFNNIKNPHHGTIEIITYDWCSEYTIMNNHSKPVELYNSHRLGQTMTPEQLQEINRILLANHWPYLSKAQPNPQGQLYLGNIWDEAIDQDFKITSHYIDGYQNFLKWIKDFEIQTQVIFQLAGGDDDKLDYVPAFIDLFINLIELLNPDYLTEYRYSLFKIDPDYPEFFGEEETEQFTKRLNNN